jgi:hypothetical protein
LGAKSARKEQACWVYEFTQFFGCGRGKMAKDLSIQGSEATNTLAPTACLLYSIMPQSLRMGLGWLQGMRLIIVGPYFQLR